MRGVVPVVLLLLGTASCGRWGYDLAREPGLGPDAGVPDGDGGILCTGAGCDAGPMDGAPGCGALALLHESFDGAATERHWFPLMQGPAQAVLANDRVELRMPGGPPGAAAEATFNTDTSYDLRESELSVEVERVGAHSSGIELRDGAGIDRFGNFIGASRGVAFAVEDGQLVALALQGTSRSTLATRFYDSMLDRYWRLREHAGDILWETSPDGASWSSFYQAAESMDVRMVYPVLFARGPLPGPSQTFFDDLNMPASSVPGYCPASALRDEFDGSTLAPSWRPWNGVGACTVTQTGGAVEMRFPGDFSGCSLESVEAFDLREDAFTLYLPDLPDDPAFQTLIELRTGDLNQRMDVRVNGGSAQLRQYAHGMVAWQDSASFDASSTPFVRLRESGGTLYWETSPDGQAWTTDLIEDGVDVASVQLVVTGLHQGTGPASGRILHVESVNQP